MNDNVDFMNMVLEYDSFFKCKCVHEISFLTFISKSLVYFNKFLVLEIRCA